MASRPLGQECPYCGSGMAITRMTCGRCAVSVEAAFPMSLLASLPVEHQRFIEMFVLSGGSLKEIAEGAGVSYPTVRSRLDKVIESLRGEIAKTRHVRGDMLDAVGQTRGGAGSGRATHQGDLSRPRRGAASGRTLDRTLDRTLVNHVSA